MIAKSDVVTVWSMNVDHIPAEKLVNWRGVLGANELALAESIAAHMLLCKLLEAITGRKPREWAFARSGNGKLEVEWLPDWPALHCSLTHADGLVACAVSEKFPVGIDAECRQRPVPKELVATVLAPSEIALFDCAPAMQRPEIFLQLWTLREAYVKATGQGLRFPDESFFFRFDPLRIEFVQASAGVSRNWQFRTWLAERHVLSLATQCWRDGPIAVVKRAFTPEELDFAHSHDFDLVWHFEHKLRSLV